VRRLNASGLGRQCCSTAAAPWIVLLLLGTQSTTLQAYNSAGGVIPLAIGAEAGARRPDGRGGAPRAAVEDQRFCRDPGPGAVWWDERAWAYGSRVSTGDLDERNRDVTSLEH